MHKLVLSLVLSVCTLVCLSAVTQDNWAKITFADGQARSISDFNGQATAVFAFCRG